MRSIHCVHRSIHWSIHRNHYVAVDHRRLKQTGIDQCRGGMCFIDFAGFSSGRRRHRPGWGGLLVKHKHTLTHPWMRWFLVEYPRSLARYKVCAFVCWRGRTELIPSERFLALLVAVLLDPCHSPLIRSAPSPRPLGYCVVCLLWTTVCVRPVHHYTPSVGICFPINGASEWKR